MLKGISKSTTGKVHRSAVMLTIFILAALLLALSSGCSDSNNASPVLTESRASLLEEIESLLPHWDRKHLPASLDITMAECTQADLENARLLLSCHQEKDVLLHCGEEVDLNQCYAEVSEECHAVGTVSQACTEAYEVFLADDSPAAQKIMEDTIDECPGARLGAQLSQAAYKTDVAASLPLGYALHNTYTGISSAGGFAYIATSNTAGGTACQVVFKGTDSLVDVKKDLASALAEACEPEPGLNLGQCGSGFLEQYRSLRDQGLVADVQAMVGGGECSGGLSVYGHSLGAALASLFTAELWTVDAALYSPGFLKQVTFGEPRTFEPEDADRYQAAIDKDRWTNWGDPVPSLPPAILDFKHFGSAFEIYRQYHTFGSFFFYEEPQDFSPDGELPIRHRIGSYIERLEACSR